ncbi:MAG: hypothetical protein OEM21_09055 [Nitrosopumilus sp.]|nr:hypothetical protein [Nitrosopumilus sp.]
MIKVLIVASLIFGVVFSFGLTADKLPIAQMANGLETFSNDILSGLEILGLNDEDQNIGAESITAANLDFEIGILKVDPDEIPDTGDEHFINVVSVCNFHSAEDIEGDTCVKCTILDGSEQPLGSGTTELPNGYDSSDTIPIQISGENFEGQNNAFAADAVFLEVCIDTEACSVAFWSANLWAWELIPVPTDADFRTTFGVGNATFAITFEGEELENPTLLQALQAEGSGINALARESVAALLNSESAIDYPMTSDEVVIGFYGSFTSDVEDNSMTQHFVELNEDSCPLLNNGAGEVP